MKIQGYYSPSDYASAIVIPCYNEGKRINPHQYIEGLKDFSSQVFLVDDGSKDNTFEILKKLEKSVPDRFIAVKCAQNGGKAEAVRRGMNEALSRNFRHIGFMDADLATPFSEIPSFMKAFKDNPDVSSVIGVRLRLAGHNVQRSNIKSFIQKIIATMGSVLFSPKVSDTQCGAKMFRSDVLKPAVKDAFSVKWLFDQELLTRLSRLPQNRGKNWLYELPLSQWLDVGGSHVKKSDYIKCLKDYFRLLMKYGIRK
ncbi:glycosyltransferase [bacterium]|nr:glycosyltransferase [bacterium]